jgi:hypothetical protein
VNDQIVLDKLIVGSAAAVQSGSRHWQDIRVDLSHYKDQTVVLRLYQRVLIPHHEAGNAYWRDLSVH